MSYINSVFPFDGYVTLSGQYCFCGHQVVRRNPMDRAATAELVEAARSNAFSCIFLEGQETYINYADPPGRWTGSCIRPWPFWTGTTSICCWTGLPT